MALTVGSLEAFALASLLPLTTVAPYTIITDRSTGYTAVTQGTHLPPPISKGDAGVRKALIEYTILREGLAFDQDPRIAGLLRSWSTGSARAKLNKSSPSLTGGADDAEQAGNIIVKSVYQTDDHNARVQFAVTGKDGYKREHNVIIAYQRVIPFIVVTDLLENLKIKRYDRDASSYGYGH